MDAAQDMAQEAAQDVAQDLSSAAEDGSVKLFIDRGTRRLPAAEPTPNTRMSPPTLPL